jgi:hypothetical protein
MKKQYNVRPRYTCGSPAQVPLDVALRVIEDEKQAYEQVLEGVEGEARRNVARVAGLAPFNVPEMGRRGIVEEVEEHSNHWLVKCMLTGELFVRDFPNVKRRSTSCNRCRAAHDRKSYEES